MSGRGAALALVESLARAGVGLFVTAPGARNLPLLAALKERPRRPAIPCLDERAAGYLALGWMRGQALAGRGPRPAAVLCTSGTAALNLLPAVAEAREAGLPLLVLSADRPTEELGRGANQTIDQVGPFRPLVLEQASLAAEEAFAAGGPHPALARLLERLATLRGPAQLNVAFREPLLEGEEEPVAAWRGESLPEAAADVDALRGAWMSGPARARRGLVHVCDLPRREDRRAAREIARRLGWPLLPDGGSGLWTRDLDPSAPPLLTGAEDHLELLAACDVVLQLGKRPVSRRIAEALAARPGLVVDEHPGRQDPQDVGRPRLWLRPAQLLDHWARLTAPPSQDLAWQRELRRATERSAVAAAAVLGGDWTEAGIARRLALHWPADWGLLAGNSLPLRLLDQWAPGLECDLLVAANRGLSGIDGLLATAIGLQAGLGRPAAALLGDLSLLHDLGSLTLLARRRAPLLVLALNNDGGGLFRLHGASARHPWAWAAHGLELAPAAAGLGLETARPASLAELDALLEDFRARPRPLLAECRVAGADHGRRLRARRRHLAQSARPARKVPAPRLWLHGFLGDPRDWDEVITQTGRVSTGGLRPTLPGHGPAPGPVPADLAGWTDWLLDLTRGRPPLEVVGYSLGGRLALHLALAAPERVARLALLGAGPGLESSAAREERRLRDEAWAARLERDGLERWLKAWYAQPLFRPLAARLGLDELLRRRGVGEAGALAAVLRAVSPAGQANLWPRLPELAMPVLWLAGDKDKNYADVARRGAARCPRGRRALVPGSGHAAHLEEPAALGACLADFFGGRLD